MRNIQILIVDDDEHSLRFSRSAMEQLVEPECVHCASTAAETMRLLTDTPLNWPFWTLTCRTPTVFPLRITFGSIIHR